MIFKAILDVILLTQIVIYCQKYCPKCGQLIEENKFHVYEGIYKQRWQSPKPADPNYQKSYQDFYSLVSLRKLFLCIIYTGTTKTYSTRSAMRI